MDGAASPPGGGIAVPPLEVAQIVSWVASFYLLAVLEAPISADTRRPLAWVVGVSSVLAVLPAINVGATLMLAFARY